MRPIWKQTFCGSLPLEGATSTVAGGDLAQTVVRAQHRAGEGTRRVKRVRYGVAHGFTLLEVILALVILGAAMAIFGEVMQLANQNAIDLQAETQAQLLASSVMDEILAGVIDDSPANRQPLETEGDVRWIYSVSSGTATVTGVYPVIVEVEQDLEARYKPVKFRLVRWFATTPEGEEAEEESAASSQRSQQNANQSNGGQQGGAGSAGGGAGGAGSAGGAP